MSGTNKENLGLGIAICAAIVLVVGIFAWGIHGCGGIVTVECPNGTTVELKSRPNSHSFSSEAIATICRESGT